MLTVHLMMGSAAVMQNIYFTVYCMLRCTRQVTLDMGLLVAGTKYRGEFEERLKKLMDEIKQNDEIILVSPCKAANAARSSSSNSDDEARQQQMQQQARQAVRQYWM